MAAGGLDMHLSGTVAVLFACLAVASTCDTANKLTSAMLANPCSHQELEVSTPDKPKVTCGSEVPIAVFASHVSPKITMNAAKADKFYTLIMVDPDAPNHKFPKFWLHWICGNIKAKDLQASGKNFCGVAPAAYAPPTPPHGTGIHRYQFFVFEQKAIISGMKAPPSRAQFEVIKYVNDLELCSPPTAAFEFKTQAKLL